MDPFSKISMPGEAPEFLHRWGSNSRGFPPVLHKVPKTQSNLKELTQCLELLGIKPHDLTIVLYSIGGGGNRREREKELHGASLHARSDPEDPFTRTKAADCIG